jgi:hypothetical protein
VASRSEDTATGRPGEVGEALDQESIRAHPAVDADLLERLTGLDARRVDQVGAALRDALEYGAHQVRPGRPARDPEEAAARAEVPLRGPEPREGRHEGDAVTRRDRLGEGLGLVRVGDEPEVVAQPLDARPGREHDPLDAPDDLMIPTSCDDRETARRNRVIRSGPAPPRTMSSIAPVPKVILAPRVTHD